MSRNLIGGSKEVHHGWPPPVYCFLEHTTLSLRPGGKVDHAMMSILQMKRFLSANSIERAAVRTVTAFCVCKLIYNCARVDQPRNETRVSPRKCRIVENIGIL